MSRLIAFYGSAVKAGLLCPPISEMPMSFPDMKALREAAQIWQFRPPADGEIEADYRAALADHVEDREGDEGAAGIKAREIRIGRGWDEWTAEEEMQAHMTRMAGRARRRTGAAPYQE